MKKLAGAAVFVAALVVALLVTKYYEPQPAPPEPPPAPPVVADTFPPPAPPPSTAQQKVTYKVQLVTIDVAARKSHTTLVVERDRSQPAPEKLWVWTAFFIPNSGRGEVSAGAPVLVEKPFAGGDRAVVNVDGPCPWCDASGGPAGSFYARVNVSTESAAAARLDVERMSRDITTATPVVYEAGLKRNR